LTDYDNKGNPYNGEVYILRHKGFEAHAKENPEKIEEMLSFALDCMGYPYSTKQIAKIIYRLFFKKSVDKVLWKHRKEWICSVLVGDLYKVFGIIVQQKDWNKGANYLIPGDYKTGKDFTMIGRLV
jgi:hypothetical protein